MTLQATTTTPIGINDIIRLVCDTFDVPEKLLRGRSKFRRAAMPRQFVFILAHLHSDMSYSAIARYMRRDHTTVMFGANKIATLAMTDKFYSDTLAYFESRIAEVNQSKVIVA